MSLASHLSHRTWLWLLLIGIMLLRLIFLGAYPLADTTEARYAEMGRLIIDTGDWITPQFEKGVPFWGKPPLSFWLTAISFKALGIHEFSARLPSFILAIAVLLTVFSLGRYQAGSTRALTACLIMASSVIFWVSSGAVMTDHCLLTGTTLSMAAFWRCTTSSGLGRRIWGWLFFIGLSIGLMSKGPVAVVLTFFPILAWGILRKAPLEVLKHLPWKTGILTVMVLTLPWYIVAEIKTPGFLEYFIVGEHLNRFLVPGWQGDLYGSAHDQPKGMIWMFWIVCALPWSLFFAYHLFKKETRRSLAAEYREANDWYLYLIFWASAPMIFFTLAGNILWAYVLPGIPAFALLCAAFLDSDSACVGIKKTATGLLPALLLLSFIVSLGVGPSQNSQKELIHHFNRIRQNETLHYFQWRPFSAEFYSNGSAGELSSFQDIKTLMNDDKKVFFAIKTDHLTSIPQRIRVKLTKQEEINGYTLLREKTDE